MVTSITVARWQRYTFYDDVARMSDVLFRGPIVTRHADFVDLKLQSAWRRLHATIQDEDKYNSIVQDYRVSAVRVAMMLETARPPEADQIDGHFELPDARTLASLLSLRCEKDDFEELHEMYRLICQKLHGEECAMCGRCFDEGSSAGLFDGADTLVIPVTVPKVFVPQCGHAIHTLCFGEQLLPENSDGMRGRCRFCGLPYAWTSIDVEPMVLAFCLLFGSYVDRRAQEIARVGEVIHSSIVNIARICDAFSQEVNGLISPASAWILLTKRHCFSEPPETIDIISDAVMQLIIPPEAGESVPLCQVGVIGPEDRSDDESVDGERDEHVMEVFVPDTCVQGHNVGVEVPCPESPGLEDCGPPLPGVGSPIF
jgi:hypothetical protein